MNNSSQMTIRCANCGNPIPANVRTIIDVQRDPEGKALLIGDQLNKIQCPNCGAVNAMDVPILYHDASKELLIAYVPMGLAAQQSKNDERVIGDMMNALTGSMPKDQFKAYMFSPKRALTLHGMVEQILQADGIAPEVLAQQRARVELIQQLLEAQDEPALVTLIKQHNDKIDIHFVQTLDLMAQRLATQGAEDVAEALGVVEANILEHSTFGQELSARQAKQAELINSVANDVQALGEEATHSDLADLAVRYAEDDDRLQALVGLARPAFDYQFFQELSDRIGKLPANERAAVESLRDRMLRLTQQVDQEAQASLQRTVQLLQQIMSSSDPLAAIEANVHLIDDEFMQVLALNIQETQKQGNAQASAQLRQVYDKVIELMQAQMSPELRFLNELLNIEDDQAMLDRLRQEAPKYGNSLLQIIGPAQQLLAAQGQQGLIVRLQQIESVLEKMSL